MTSRRRAGWRKKRRGSAPRLLGVLLCYNDGDLVSDAVQYLREQGHHVVAWDHGSDDDTPAILRRLEGELVELQTIPRTVDFYDLYPEMSRRLLTEYVRTYEWISWPDQDEFLEGADRSRSYKDWLEEVVASQYDWIEFRNFNYWWTEADDPNIRSVPQRVRHYSLFAGCPPRIRSWRASATNRREFNHNPPLGKQYPVLFNLRHYPMRSYDQMIRRLDKDRSGLRRGALNVHYENMSSRRELLTFRPEQLHYDDGRELNPEPVVDWSKLYW